MEGRVVDRVLIERILTDINANVTILKNARDIDWQKYQQDMRTRRFVERTLHILIEACIDIAQHIISDERLREPSSYRDTFAVLAEAGILDQEDLLHFEKMASFRNMIVHYYERLDDAVVYGVFKNNLADFDVFIKRIVDYLARHEMAPPDPAPTTLADKL
jgi:uncharacterized protein YutE (UPF0331/DUF86 family)